MWRPDGQCGQQYPLQDGSGRPGQCDPDSDSPCCSSVGWCGISDAHCKCPGCKDFRRGCPFEEDIKYYLANINNGDQDPLQSSAEDCRTYCKSNHGTAKYFSWFSSAKTCWCKTSDIGRTYSSGATSGQVTCDMTGELTVPKYIWFFHMVYSYLLTH